MASITSLPGHAQIDPSVPEALGICDRCGNQWNLRNLQYQFYWAGPQLQNSHLRVCPDCMDIPNEQLRTIVLPPDPEPVYDTRVPPFAIYEQSAYILVTEDFVMLTTESGLILTTELQTFDE